MAFVPAPGYQPAYNPSLPYVAPVMGGLWPGMAVYVQGLVLPHANKFWVNLANGPGEGDDLALHLNPRFGGEGQAVLNSRCGGQWGQEQRRDLQPFLPGTPFEIVITVTPHAYRVLVNGSHFDEFLHRLPAEQVTAVTVDGDLELHSVTILGAGVSPPFCSPQDVPQTIPYLQSNLPVMGQPPTLHPPVPFVATIPGGLIPKKTIVVKGFIPPDADRFHVNLRAGAGGDVLLHFNPRLSEGVVVRNSLLGGAWGAEELDLPHNPFQRGRYFDLSIRCGNHRFKVFAEGQPLCHFSHRLPPGPHVDTLEVDGDVILSYVHF
ncbi:galectin-4 [Gavia stellata]|uniref:galectin-4 n=1 Tax=Gavia stellata TaxID=37040 RepID=UPI00289AB4A4|nr:galectin-4 [Gavia stellata]